MERDEPVSEIGLQQNIDVDKLPTLPAIAIEAMRLMEGENSNFESVAELLKNDQVLTSRVLHYANSAYVGSRNRITAIGQAVSLLGFNTTRSIILSASIFNSLNKGLFLLPLANILPKSSLNASDSATRRKPMLPGCCMILEN